MENLKNLKLAGGKCSIIYPGSLVSEDHFSPPMIEIDIDGDKHYFSLSTKDIVDLRELLNEIISPEMERAYKSMYGGGC